MDTEKDQSEPMKNQSETKTQKQKEATNFQQNFEITYSNGKCCFKNVDY